MRSRSRFFLLSSLCIFFFGGLLAHPGRTDKNVGHFDHVHGTYHYHHGFKAHDHPNGQCPLKRRGVISGVAGSLLLLTVSAAGSYLLKKKK